MALETCTNSIGVEFVLIPAGTFWMGSDDGNSEEKPRHEVEIPHPFYLGRYEVTQAQWRAVMEKGLPGWNNPSCFEGADRPVECVTWYETQEFIFRLNREEGHNRYRLPTEAEWEYAARAGSTGRYCFGDDENRLEEYAWYSGNSRGETHPVGQKRSNAWGLYDMHGNVEEWCFDLVDGQYRAVRGGSHNTPVEFLATDYRCASIPQDRSVLLGFRVVESDLQPSDEESGPMMAASDAPRQPWGEPSAGPVFLEPIPYVIPPVNASMPFYSHNHQPAVTWTPGGALLAIWFSTEAEAGREMVVLQSTFDGRAWTPATLFCKVPGRNMTGSALLTLDTGEILHFQGVGDAGEWKDLALAMRRCPSFGEPWSPLRYIEPEHEVRHQVIAGPIVTRDGRILLCCDAGPDGEAGSALHVSRDGGKTWEDSGSLIKGIHAGIVELQDGRLMAYGRGNAIDGRMPCSVSADGGRTWTYRATEFPPIGSGQRLVLRRLQEGPLMLCSFGEKGLFVALSYDEGESWPLQKLLTDGKKRVLDGGAWTGTFTLDATHTEPKGYLACTQSPDGMIHLLSSRVHYRFNLAWIQAR